MYAFLFSIISGKPIVGLFRPTNSLFLLLLFFVLLKSGVVVDIASLLVKFSAHLTSLDPDLPADSSDMFGLV